MSFKLQSHIEQPVFTMEWNKLVPLKVNLFGWKAEMGRFATSDALCKRKVLNETNWCPLCEGERESVEHILLSCYVASEIWQFISSWCGIPPIYAFEIRDLLKTHLLGDHGKNKRKAIHSVILTACWCVFYFGLNHSLWFDIFMFVILFY